MPAQAQPTAAWEVARQAAARVALRAWVEAIEPYYEAEYCIHEKVDGPCTEADRAADRLIVELLKPDYPEPATAYLTEESEANPRRLEAARVWIIDPIDGTKDFIKRNGNFAVHIGLVERLDDGAYHPVATAVYWPIAGWLYTAVRGGGAWRVKVESPATLNTPQAVETLLKQSERIRVTERSHLAEMRSPVSNSNRESRLMRLIHSLELEDYWHIGSLGIKLSQIAEGRAELYINLGLGKVKEWDTCAPWLVLTEAGGVLTDLNGNPLAFNQPDFVHHHGLLASNAVAHDELVARVQDWLEMDARLHQ